MVAPAVTSANVASLVGLSRTNQTQTAKMLTNATDVLPSGSRLVRCGGSHVVLAAAAASRRPRQASVWAAFLTPSNRGPGATEHCEP
jgi:hypothetical protein